MFPRKGPDFGMYEDMLKVLKQENKILLMQIEILLIKEVE